MAEILLNLEPYQGDEPRTVVLKPLGCGNCKPGSGRRFVVDNGFNMPGEGHDDRSWPSHEKDMPCHRAFCHGEQSGICRSTNVKG